MFKQLRIEPAPKITCTAEHSRPAGRFLWFLGEVGSSGMIMSVRFISSISAQRHGSDKWQSTGGHWGRARVCGGQSGLHIHAEARARRSKPLLPLHSGIIRWEFLLRAGLKDKCQVFVIGRWKPKKTQKLPKLTQKCPNLPQTLLSYLWPDTIFFGQSKAKSKSRCNQSWCPLDTKMS